MGHKDTVTTISVDQDDGFLVTGAKDMQVRLWSEGLDMWGFIDQVSEVVDPLWYFPKEVFDRR